MDYANDAKRVRVPIDAEVGMDRPEEKVPVREVAAFVAHARDLSELVKRSIEILKDSVRGVEAIRGNELPDVLKVTEGAPGEFELLHGRCRRRSAL